MKNNSINMYKSLSLNQQVRKIKLICRDFQKSKCLGYFKGIHILSFVWIDHSQSKLKVIYVNSHYQFHLLLVFAKVHYYAWTFIFVYVQVYITDGIKKVIMTTSDLGSINGRLYQNSTLKSTKLKVTNSHNFKICTN